MVCPWVFSPSTGAKPCSSAAHSLRKKTLFCLFLRDSYYLGIGLCSIPTFGAVLTFPWSYTPSITPENDMTSLGLSTPISPSTSRLPTRLTVTSYSRVSYGLSFASITATLTHAFLYYRKRIWNQVYRPLSKQSNIHARLMSVYKEVSNWWHLTIFGSRHLFLK